MYDDDFVIDGSGSEEEERRKKKAAVRSGLTSLPVKWPGANVTAVSDDFVIS